ncbi:MAG: hypothetical protein HYU81_03200 [Candidatus Brennerbacteria bacterium]|nr:hypothetical protein [Candidatus Brennerbacteria bacterium]
MTTMDGVMEQETPASEKRGGKIKWVGGVAAVVALAAIAISFYNTSGPRRGEFGPTGEARGEDVFRPGNANALKTVEGGTREKIKTSAFVTDVNATARVAAPSEIAVPFAVQKVGDVMLRKFAFRGEDGNLSPSLVAVNELDVVDFSFTAADRDYAIRFPDFGVYRSVKRGETAVFQFQAYPYGEYAFECVEGCGKGDAGKLVVNR